LSHGKLDDPGNFWPERCASAFFMGCTNGPGSLPLQLNIPRTIVLFTLFAWSRPGRQFE